MRFLFAILGAVIAAAPAFPQVRASGSCGGSGASMTATLNVHVNQKIQAVTGAPYSARESNESVRSLADGTHLTGNGGRETVTWRDSSGRVRVEEHPVAGKSLFCNGFLSEIEDPVAGYIYILDSVHQIAYRLPLTLIQPARSAAEIAIERPRKRPQPPGRTAEPLGTKTMAGVKVVGVRETITLPADPRLGTGAIDQTVETWTAPDLALVIYSKTSRDGQEGVTSLKDLSTAEPDPALFQAPPGYKITDEAGPFTISVHDGASAVISEASPSTAQCTSTYPQISAQQVVTGAPYSARETTPIPVGGDRVWWRDSSGRTRMEHQSPPEARATCVTPTIIDDPVAGSVYVLDSVNRVAHRVSVKFPPAITADLSLRSPRSEPNATSESLGSETMFGVTVVGTRETTTYPIGSMGNDRVLTSTREDWVSPSLGLIVSSVESGPVNGTHTTGLKDVTTAEPDPSLFRIPEGYKIVDETGPFTISTASSANQRSPLPK